jgi:stearoyl-CoA desaturase (delta-9 desaturase)
VVSVNWLNYAVLNEFESHKGTSMKKILQSILQWFENKQPPADSHLLTSNHIDLVRALPFILLNLSCLLVFYVGASWTAVITAVVLCWVRVFSIGAFYHRLFAHRAFKTNRFWQFIFAVMGNSAAQRGPLWWATHHRRHHAVADQPEDAHSPVQHSFFWSHIGWFLAQKNYYYNPKYVSDLTRFPELVFLDRYDSLVPIVLGITLFSVGVLLSYVAPQLHTTGLQMFIWGFSISTVMLFHVTVSINSLSHRFGRRKYNTKDNSRNNWFLALLTFGEGWHNNHHHYPASANQGFRFWEIDITYYLLCFLQSVGIIWDVKKVPRDVLENH